MIYPVPATTPAHSVAMFRLLCFWHLRKHPNGVVFNRLRPSLPVFRKNYRDDTVLWRGRLSLDQHLDVEDWLSLRS
jgi:hypothetical protein